MDADERTSDLVRYTSVKLSTSNYMMFVVSFRNNVGSYGDAGTELINEVYHDFKQSFPFKTASVTEPHMATDGTISEITRPWDVKLDNAALINDRKIWKESQHRYLRQRGRLWTLIISSLSPEVLQACTRGLRGIHEVPG